MPRLQVKASSSSLLQLYALLARNRDVLSASLDEVLPETTAAFSTPSGASFALESSTSMASGATGTARAGRASMPPSGRATMVKGM